MEISYDIEVAYGRTTEIALIGTGNFSNSKNCLNGYKFMRDNYQRLLENIKDHFKNKSLTTHA